MSYTVMYSRKGTTLFCLPSLRETQQSNLFLCVSWSEITGKEIKHCQLALRSPLCIPQMTLAGCIGVLSPVHLQPLSHTGKPWHDMGDSSQGPVLNLSWFCSIIRSSTPFPLSPSLLPTQIITKLAVLHQIGQ